jgi:hypothetical protein
MDACILAIIPYIGLPSPLTLAATPSMTSTHLGRSVCAKINYTIFQVCCEGNGTTELALETTPDHEGNISISSYNLCTDTLIFYTIPYSTLGQGQQSNNVILNQTGICNDNYVLS